MVHEDNGHGKDKPGKDKLLCNLIVSVTGKEEVVVSGRQGGHGGGQGGEGHYEGGASAIMWDDDVVDDQAGQNAAPGQEVYPQEGGHEDQNGEPSGQGV